MIVEYAKALSSLLVFLAIPVAILTAALIAKAIASTQSGAKLLRLGIHDIDQLSGRDFERLLRPLFQEKGYDVELTPHQNDRGADLVISRSGVRTVVQAKRSKKAVGVAAIQQVVAAKAVYRATQALVITNSSYTTAAQKLAHANGVYLWERNRLVSELEKVRSRVEA